MPKPGKKETKSEFIQRCIRQVSSEGVPQDQAIAMCYSMWEQKSKYEPQDAEK